MRIYCARLPCTGERFQLLYMGVRSVRSFALYGHAHSSIWSYRRIYDAQAPKKEVVLLVPLYYCTYMM